jgi:hypothetical protein
MYGDGARVAAAAGFAVFDTTLIEAQPAGGKLRFCSERAEREPCYGRKASAVFAGWAFAIRDRAQRTRRRSAI